MNTLLVAAETAVLSEGVKTAFTTAVETVQGGATEMVTLALPAALGIMGLFLVIKLGIGFFKSIAH